MKQIAFRTPAPLIKTIIFLVWLFLFGLLMQRDFFITTINPEESSAIAQAAREEYQSIYFHNRKIGYVATTFEPRDDGRITLDQKAGMVLNVAGGKHPVNLHLEAVITADSRLQDFVFSFRSPFYRMQADGRSSGNSVSFTLATGSTTIRERIDLPAPPMLSTSRRDYLLQPGITVGENGPHPLVRPAVAYRQGLGDRVPGPGQGADPRPGAESPPFHRDCRRGPDQFLARRPRRRPEGRIAGRLRLPQGTEIQGPG